MLNIPEAIRADTSDFYRTKAYNITAAGGRCKSVASVPTPAMQV